MPIPSYDQICQPLLKLLANEEEIPFRAVTDQLSTQFKLTDEELNTRIPSGQILFYNRAGWARTYLKKAGLIESPRRGYIKITNRGLQVLRENPPLINAQFLLRYPEFQAFKEHNNSQEKSETPPQSDGITPEEAMDSGYKTLRASLEEEILERVKSCSPSFFERLVVDLLVSMGYGGSHQDAGRAVGHSGDGGIDGIIKEDKLGLDAVYIQAKRWDGNNIGRPEVQKFAGALQGHRAKKGVFITTSSFTRDAQEYTNTVEAKIILISGAELAKLMLDYNVGASTVCSYEIKKLDFDYFIEE